jgi:hypothetical protein
VESDPKAQCSDHVDITVYSGVHHEVTEPDTDHLESQADLGSEGRLEVYIQIAQTGRGHFAHCCDYLACMDDV